MRKIKTLLLAVFLITVFTKCNQGDTTQKISVTDSTMFKTDSLATPIVGGDKDEHGCKASAGYKWSIIKKDCIRLFETAIRLKAHGDDDTSVMSAFIIFSTDEKQAELFLPDNTISLIMEHKGKEGNDSWENGRYKLYPWKGGYILNKGKEMIYAGHAND